MIRIRLLWIVATALALIAMACGGSSGSSSSEYNAYNAESFPMFLEASQAASESAMLTLADFPPGWTSFPAEPNYDIPYGLSEDCAVLDTGVFPDEVFVADSAEFVGPNGQAVTSRATVFTSEEVAANALESVINALALNSCRVEFVEAIRKVLFELLEEEIELSLLDLSFPSLGESSASFRNIVEVFGESSSFDTTFIRKGKMVGRVDYLSPPNSIPDIVEETEIVELFSEKLKAAEATIPD